MASSEDDEDLKRAIALSLQDQSLAKEPDIIEIDSDDNSPPMTKAETAEHVDKSQVTRETLSSMLGLNRKQMEEERLARKRKLTSISPPPPRKAAKTAPTQDNKRPFQEPDKTTSNAPTESTPGNPPGLTFPHGTVKQTWAQSHPRTNTDITLTEVLQASTLTHAVLSSFQWDFDWLVPQLNPQHANLTFVLQAKDALTKQHYETDFGGIPNVRLCFPPMEGQVHCMHSKLMLLAHPGYLRVVVPTANLVPYDWGEGGVMENSVFLIDLPRRAAAAEEETMPFFGRELVFFLKAMGLEMSVVRSLYKFDFGATDGLAFVHTVGGAHTSQIKVTVDGEAEVEPWRRTGYCGLGRAVRELGLESEEEVEVDYVTSSIGSLTQTFLTTLYVAAQGSSSPVPSSTKTSAALAHTNLYFPTHSTVAASTGGTPCGGTNCFHSKWFRAPTFPRDVLRDCRSVRKGLLMHNKIIYVRLPDSRKHWAYIGSANCSESAWGKMGKVGGGGRKLNCRNWECGVLVPVRRKGGGSGQDEKGEEDGIRGEGLGMFNDTVPVPMEFPGEKYGERKPWFYAEQ